MMIKLLAMAAAVSTASATDPAANANRAGELLSAAGPACPLSGSWVMSHGHLRNGVIMPSKDNMTITQQGESFTVACATEKWKTATGS